MKSKYGTSMSSTEHIEKAKPITCDCALCYFIQRTYWGELYCQKYDEFSPKRNKCRFYWRTKSPKSGKKKTNAKKL